MMKPAPWGAEVLRTLQNAGFLAYAVGGCVRDCLLGRQPMDWDIATSALPQQIMSLFSRTVATGLKHGTVTVLIDSKPVEVTTFRKEGAYSDCRRPDEVIYTDLPEEDAARRDFTINALYWDGYDTILDFFGGKQDLERKVIRTVGEGSKRFSEDALRILRCARFSAQLGFEVSESTKSAMREKADLLQYISRERIGEEWEKILMSDPIKGFSILWETGCHTVTDCRINATKEEWQRCADLPFDAIVRWAALLWNSYDVREILKHFRRDKKTISRCVWLTEQKNKDLSTDYALKRLVADSSEEAVEQLTEIRQDIKERFCTIKNREGFVTMNNLALTGEMMLRTGLYTGREIGEAREWLLDQVLLGHVSNNSANLTKKLTEKR
ncbi:MAG: CCA tRNA nucleotidyltransferase [Ruminococcaceae bacterium]|nr:CCA tRNA nucleotidyltransferase [Oscillospiraceae bacterium]